MKEVNKRVSYSGSESEIISAFQAEDVSSILTTRSINGTHASGEAQLNIVDAGFETPVFHMNGELEITQVITLKGISKHGKDRIHQYGDKWIIKQMTGNVGFDDRGGLWLGLASLDGRDFRWVRAEDDKNFKIIR